MDIILDETICNNKLSIKWTIDNFNTQNQPTGQYIESSYFGNRRDPENKLYLHLYPNGYTQEDYNYISIYMCTNSNFDLNAKIKL